jgi:hypothetical protein
MRIVCISCTSGGFPRSARADAIRKIWQSHCVSSLGDGLATGVASAQGAMGKGQAFRARSADSIHRGRLGAIAVLLFDALFLALFLVPAQVRPAETLNPQVSLSSAESLDVPFDSVRDNPSFKQTLYPYSVIPGGVQTSGELRNAIANDPVVRAHYADFVVASTRLERIGKTQAFYVSYRIGSNIFWTKNAMMLHAGEAVLSDGVHMARTRCGNRLSLAPIAPISKIEPVPAAMEIASPAALLATNAAPAELPFAPIPLTTIVTPPPVPPAPPIGIFLPLPPFFPIGASGTPVPPGPPVPPSTPPPPPVAAPEPSALLMLAAGLGCLLLLKKLQ